MSHNYFLLFQIIELVEIEMREMLSDFGFNGSATPLIFGSALKALNDDESEIGTFTYIILLSGLFIKFLWNVN